MDRIRSVLLDHRRLLAAACTGLAVLLAVGAVRQPADTVVVAVAGADLPSGHRLVAADVQTARFPASLVPEHALADDTALVGRRVGGPMRAGEMFTDTRVLSGGPGDDLPVGQVVSTLRLADPAALQGLRVGDRVDVLAVAPDDDGPRATVVAEGVTVAALSEGRDDTDTTLTVVVPRPTALALARTALESQVSVVGSGHDAG